MLGYCAYGGASAMLLLFTSIHDPFWAMCVMSLSAFAAEFSGPISWTTAMDLGGRHVGALSAAMNMMGHFGGSVAPATIGYILEATGYALDRSPSTAPPRFTPRAGSAGRSSIR